MNDKNSKKAKQAFRKYIGRVDLNTGELMSPIYDTMYITDDDMNTSDDDTTDDAMSTTNEPMSTTNNSVTSNDESMRDA